MISLREHLERIRDRHGQGLGDQCYRCEVVFPCPDFEDAVAALATLDAARKHEVQCTCSDGFARYMPGRLVPDPLVPRLDANPNTKEDA